MTIASSNFTTLAYQEETAYGVLPVAGAFRLTPFTGESFQFTKESISSNNINSSRQISDVIATGFNVSGGFDIELAAKTFDELSEGALWERWSTSVDEVITATVVGTSRTVTASAGTPFAQVTTGQFVKISGMVETANNGIFQVLSVTDTVLTMTTAYTMADESDTASVSIKGSMLRNGTTRLSYYVEKSFTDLNPVQRFSYSGCLINAMSIAVQSSSIITGSFDFMGKTSTAYTGVSDSPETVLASVGNNILNAVSHMEGVRIDGVEQTAAGVYFQGIDYTLSNNLRGIQAIGTEGNVGVAPGQLEVSGSMNTYFTNSDMYSKFVDGTEFSLSYELIDENGEGYVISFPRATISNDAMSASGGDQDLVENLSWSAMMSATDNIAPSTSIQIDRFLTDYTTAPDQV